VAADSRAHRCVAVMSVAVAPTTVGAVEVEAAVEEKALHVTPSRSVPDWTLW
jgi:hypothetical protein